MSKKYISQINLRDPRGWGQSDFMGWSAEDIQSLFEAELKALRSEEPPKSQERTSPQVEKSTDVPTSNAVEESTPQKAHEEPNWQPVTFVSRVPEGRFVSRVPEGRHVYKPKKVRPKETAEERLKSLRRDLRIAMGLDPDAEPNVPPGFLKVSKEPIIKGELKASMHRIKGSDTKE